MNCKPGDLAIAISSCPTKKHNVGALLRVISLSKRPGKWNVELLQDCVIDGFVYRAGSICYASDSRLRPIRDNDGEDETLQWAGKPESINA
jgi:hypothetical protein